MKKVSFFLLLVLVVLSSPFKVSASLYFDEIYFVSSTYNIHQYCNALYYFNYNQYAFFPDLDSCSVYFYPFSISGNNCRWYVRYNINYSGDYYASGTGELSSGLTSYDGFVNKFSHLPNSYWTSIPQNYAHTLDIDISELYDIAFSYVANLYGDWDIYYNRSGSDSVFDKYSSFSSSFDGQASIDGFTVKNISRYIQDLRYSVSFDEGTFEDKLSGSILENLAQLKIQTYYSLQCPSLSWLENSAAAISNFDDWYSLRASVPQTTVCNNWVQYVYRPKDEYIKELPFSDNKRTNLANISSVTSQIYGRQLSDIEQKLFDVLCYPQTVGVRSTWLLSSLFGYGPLRIINIGPTLLNGRAINASGFSGDSSANGVNSYLWNDDTLTDSDQNDTDQVVPIGNSTSTGYPSETVINNNYNEYITYNNYYPTVSSGGIQNVYVVNYEDFTSNITNSSNQEIINNYEFNFGDLNISAGITNAANEVNNSFSDLTSGENGGVAKIGADFISVVPSDIAVVLFGIIGASIIALVINKMRS